MNRAFSRVSMLFLAIASVPAVTQADPLDTSFTYQGLLSDSGEPASGAYDLHFRLFDAASGGIQLGPELCLANVAMTDGHFNASLDFGSQFNGQKRFLEVLVRSASPGGCGDPNGFTTLDARQELTASPNATFASTASTASNALSLGGQSASSFATLAGNNTFTGKMSFTNPGNTFAGSFNGTFAGDGSAITSLNGANLSAGTVARSSFNADVQHGMATATLDWTAIPYQSLGTAPQTAAGNIAASVGSVLFVAGDGRLQLLDISNPASPTPIEEIPTFANGAVDLAFVGNFAYVGYNAGTISQILILDITNPVTPVPKGSVNFASNLPVQLAATETTLYAVTNDGAIRTYSVSTADGSLTLAGAGSVSGFRPTQVVANNTHLFAITDGQYLNSVDMWDPNNPFHALQINTAIPNAHFVLNSGHLYVLGSSGPLYVLDGVSFGLNVQQTVPVSIPTNGVIACAANVLFISGLSSGTPIVQTYDITDPVNPRVISQAATLDSWTNIASSGPYAYGPTPSTKRIGIISGGYTLQFSGTLSGAASKLTNLSASALSGTIPSASLAGADGSGLTNLAGALANVDGSGLVNLQAANIAGVLAFSQLPTAIARTNTTNAFGNFANSFAGNVGIGTTTPAYRLDVTGQLREVSTGAQGLIVVGTGAGTNPAEIFFDRSQAGSTFDAAFGVASDRGGFWWVNGTDRIRINPSTGAVSVLGSLSKGGGSFKIDHPLDPENKFLYHSFVESPDMMNIYNGNVTTDEHGYATIELPDYFEALNRDFRYQLTILDEDDNDDFSAAKIVKPVDHNLFTIRTARGNVTVSWQVTGIRRDAWANQNRIPNSVEKAPEEHGKYLHPEAFGLQTDRGIYFHPQADNSYPATAR